MVDDLATPEMLAERVRAGNRRAVGRAISLIENADPLGERVLRVLYPFTGHTYVVGITGPPGAGKSTLVDELIRVIRRDDHSVGVIAVDPNSPFSGGAVLGDRIRMMRHAVDRSVFIRSMGARGHLGGLSLAAYNTTLVLDAMGVDVVLLETVGVGQSELEIAGVADTTVVVIPPGLGDGVQAIKAGIMEIADVFVVNKADHPQSAKTVSDIRELLRMDAGRRPWQPPIVRSVATQGEGIEDVWRRIGEHREYLLRSGEMAHHRRSRLQREIEEIIERRLWRKVLEPWTESPGFQDLLDQAMNRKIDPYTVAERLLAPLVSAAER